MSLNQLLYVVEVSKTKSINATAHALFVSQSCVSTAIRELEDELGILLENVLSSLKLLIIGFI
ncbi:MAG: LysR family transcriptional regulator [Eubacteriales bacterium]|nr:LysR family transcriptional regulator [Eubacteriales bacterium]